MTDPTGFVLAERYEVEALLGVGGMGSVYRARDMELGEQVALKVLRPELVADPEALSRFRQEVRLARRVTHPNVARVFDIGEHAGGRHLTMELIEGETLTRLIAREGPLSTARAVLLLRGILAGLDSIHAAGIIHRDLKPDNVLVRPGDRPAITDFGIARPGSGALFLESAATATANTLEGTIVGTPEYMAPEQVRGVALGPPADLFALGIIAFELLSQSKPWSGATPLAAAISRLTHPPRDLRTLRPQLNLDLLALVERLLAREPEDRPASASEVLDLLDGVDLKGPPTLTGQRRRTTLPAAAGEEPPGAPRVAVLSFRTDEGQAHLGDAVTEALADTLCISGGFRVLPRPAPEDAAEASDPLRFGRRLGADVVVHGNVRGIDDQVVVTARAQSVLDGLQFFTQRVQGPLGALLANADTLGNALTEALSGNLPSRPPPCGPLSDPQALDLYLQARRAYHSFTTDSVRAALPLFDAALARAPNEPLYAAGLALALIRIFGLGHGTDAERDRARQLADSALLRAPGLAEAHIARGSIALNEGDVPLAARHARLGLLAAPGLADARELVGRLLLEAGDLEGALAQIRTAAMLEPRMIYAHHQVARACGLLGDWTHADLDVPIDAVGDPGVMWLTVTHRARMMLWRRDREAARRLRPWAVEHFGVEESGGPTAILELLDTGLMPPRGVLFLRRMQSLPPGARLRVLAHQIEAEVSAFVGDLEVFDRAIAASVQDGLFDLAWWDRCALVAPLLLRPTVQPLRAQVAERAARIVALLRGDTG